MAGISTFTVTFVVEAKCLSEDYREYNSSMGEDINCLGPPQHGIRLSYTLYPNVAYDLDILIWPRYAKIWHQAACAWVRTWVQEGRTWIAFTLRHALRVETPVMRDHLISLTVTEGLSALGPQLVRTAKNDTKFEVYCPTPAKLQPPQFPEVFEDTEILSNERFVRQLVWRLVVNYIPMSHLDGIFDAPQRVTDVRHRDAVLGAVNEEVSEVKTPSPVVSLKNVESKQINRSRRRLAAKQSAKGQAKHNGFEIHFTGNAVLAGAGRVTKGERTGARRTDHGAVVMLLSSCNLPAVKQYPVFFVNTLRLRDMPVAALRAAGFSQLYIRWKVLDFVHSTPPCPVSINIFFGNPQSIPLEPHRAAQLLAFFQEKLQEVEIRGLRTCVSDRKPAVIFGTSTSETVFGLAGISPLKIPFKEMDVLVAICRIDLKTLIHSNAVIKESFPVFPAPCSLLDPPEKLACTNVINAIRTPKASEKEISTSDILNASPTLTLSIGYVGCRPVPIAGGFGRLLCVPNNVEATSEILDEIFRCNEISENKQPNEYLTGWAVDMGASAIIYVEGPHSGHVSSVWTRALQNKNSNAYFDTTARYTHRLYPGMRLGLQNIGEHVGVRSADLLEAEPFLLLRLHVPLAALLACPLLYVRPALPLPARAALLKLGRLAACGLEWAWPGDGLPSAAELRSLALELAAQRCPHPRTTSH